ncbi:sugar phosphate nucleotidyltransferase [Halosolutus gelatinilyticus]|uniref:sugar phosphate nucleotidyltransferase n=1 Tax=Halosolutus gelatinilyticus TaxID=2931975 RepID=UPI001FF5BAD5|nr:sugar phosphate nucleotidyltransferase [Halosolutus gelatinilyticus]
MEIPAVVLAAGEGRRLRPLTHHRPKPMLPVVSKPILEHVFDSLIAAGVTDIVVVVGYGRNRIQSYVGSSYRDATIRYVVQDRQLGTGHALLTARSVVDGRCLVINGDQIVTSDLVDEVLSDHDATDSVATIGVLNRAEVGEYGGVLLDDDRVTEIIERPSDDQNYRLNAGVYALEPTVFDAVEAATPDAGEHSLTDAFRRVIEWGEPVRGVVSPGPWIDVKYPWDLLQATETLIASDAYDYAIERIDSSATIHETAVVSSSAVVAAGCEIGPGAVVGQDVSLNENVTVDANAVVERSVVDMDARIGQNATVIDSVVGQGVGVGPGTVLPGGPSEVRIGNRIHENVQFGTLLADRVRDEGGTTYAPGTVVGANALVRSGGTVDGTIASGTEVQP